VKRYIIEKGLVGKVALRVTGCHGFCEMGPFILTEPQQAFYTQVSLDDIPKIVEALLLDEYVEELLYRDFLMRLGWDDVPGFMLFKDEHGRKYLFPRSAGGFLSSGAPHWILMMVMMRLRLILRCYPPR